MTDTISKAYTLIPNNKEELQKVLDLKWPLNSKQKDSANHKAQKEILKLYDTIAKSNFNNPFAFQTHSSNKNIKIMRLLELDNLHLPSLPNVKMDYGNGSRNGQGKNNNGFKYENLLGRALSAYAIAGQEGLSKYPTMVSTVNDIIKILPSDHVIMKVIPAGKSNNKRKVPIDESGIHTVTDGDDNIGDIISDITIVSQGRDRGSSKNTYISAKFGDTVAFLNLGLKQWFHKDEIKSGIIKNTTAKDLLLVLGINENEFCNAFNNYDKLNSKRTTDIKPVTQKINKTKLMNIVKSTIGYGYIMVHKQKGGTIVKEISKNQMNKYLQFKGISVQYPVDGSVKLVKAKVKLSGLDIDFAIRATDGSVYPTHMVANYTYTNL